MDFFIEDYDKKIAIPREIIDDTADIKYNQRALFVSYYYLASYFYLYAKYGTDKTLQTFTKPNIANFLNLNYRSPIFREVVRRNGLTDQLGYTQEITDPPMDYHFTQEPIDYNHRFLSELKQITNINTPSRFTTKFPIKAYYREEEDMDSRTETGTVVDPSNTIMITVKTYHKLLTDPSLSYKDFLTYVWIRYYSDNNKDKIFLSGEMAKHKLKIERKTYERSTKRLHEKGFIKREAVRKNESIEFAPILLTVLKK